MYRNCFYNQDKGEVCLFTWDSKGKRIEEHIPFECYLYIESQSQCDATSIYNTPLRKLSFRRSFDRFRFLQDSGIKRIFYCLNAEQQYLIEAFRNKNTSPEFSKFPLKTFFLDIEVLAPVFPNPNDAQWPVSLITIYDSLTNKFMTWGLKKDFVPTLPNSTYIKCATEKELFVKVFDYWKKDYPDVVSGWAGESFDIPYLINRTINLFDEQKVRELSPVGRVYCRKGLIRRFGKVESKWFIKGMSYIDYMEAYKVFSRVQQESYGLGNVAEAELGIGKTKTLATNLTTVADTNWQQFTEYNINDVYLLVKLEEKLQFLAQIRELAYIGLTNFEQAMGTISVVTGALAINSLKKGQVISTFHHKGGQDFEGGYVREPIRGMHEGIVTFDVNSLYPNLIITLNLSPETKLGKVHNRTDGQVNYSLINDRTYTVPEEEFEKYLVDNKISLSKANVMFQQGKQGVCPELIDGVYTQRVKIRNKLKSLRKDLAKIQDTKSEEYLALKFKTDQLDIRQYVLKILANRTYGYFSNKHSPFYDIDLASSITLTGQACIRKASEIANAHIKEKYKVETDSTIYGDTDSLYLTINPILQKYKIPLAENNVVTDKTHRIVTDLEQTLNQKITEWATKELHSIDSRLEFKREAICDVGIFLEKKRYILHILDEEGIASNKTKYVGVEVASSAIPKKVKELIKKIVETMIKTKSATETNKMFTAVYERFKKLKIEELAFPRGINKVDEYTQLAKNLTAGKGTPAHVKAALVYNYFINKLNVQDKYERIRSGIKIKFFYALPNKWNVDAIAFIDQYPNEFELKPNLDKMFEKSVTAAVERLYNCVKWRYTSPAQARQADLFDLFA